MDLAKIGGEQDGQDSSFSGYTHVSGSFRHSNKPSNSIKGAWKFLG
jgi:hypothetical protein